MARKSESLDTDLATLVRTEGTALNTAVTEVVETETGGA